MALKSKFIIGDLLYAKQPVCAALNAMPAHVHLLPARLAALHGHDWVSMGKESVKMEPSCFCCFRQKLVSTPAIAETSVMWSLMLLALFCYCSLIGSSYFRFSRFLLQACFNVDGTAQIIG